MVDSNDRERFQEVKEELLDLMADDRLRNAVLLVLANKQDMPEAASASEMSDKLGLNSIRSHEWYIQETCATSGTGLVDGLTWLAPKIKEAKKKSGR